MMRIGHQLYEFLEYFTKTGSYCIQDLQYCTDAQGRHLYIKEMYINYEEKQVYLVLEDEYLNLLHVSIHNFITMMGGPKSESYTPLYKVRDETKLIKKVFIKRYNKVLGKSDPEIKQIIRKIFKKIENNESN